MLRQGYLCVFLLFFCSDCFSITVSEVPEAGNKALYEILNLNINTAKKLLGEAIRKEPGRVDMYLEYLSNWNSVIETVLSEDESVYKSYIKSLGERLERIDRSVDKNTPSYRILLAEIYAHAGMAQVFYRDYLSAFLKIMKANSYAKENSEKFPGFWMNNKLCGVLNVSFDQMSPFLKKIAGIFNFKGDPATGFKQLEQYLKDVQDYPGLRADALIYYGFALRIARKDEKAYSIFREKVVYDQTPVLTLYLYSNIMSLTGRNEEARTLMSGFADTNFEVPFPFRDYLYGKVILFHLDKEAEIYLMRFVGNSKSKNYKREICSRLADYYCMQADMAKFNYYRGRISSYPKATTDRDREADVELHRPYPPLPGLLKARYLVQGGYYAQAKEILLRINKGELNLKAYRNEYNLLMAKILSGTGFNEEAIGYCIMVINEGKECNEHYASEAALVAGDIESRLGNRQKAAQYYNLALEIKGQNDVYIEIIDRMTKNRLKDI